MPPVCIVFFPPFVWFVFSQIWHHLTLFKWLMRSHFSPFSLSLSLELACRVTSYVTNWSPLRGIANFSKFVVPLFFHLFTCPWLLLATLCKPLSPSFSATGLLSMLHWTCPAQFLPSPPEDLYLPKLPHHVLQPQVDLETN